MFSCTNADSAKVGGQFQTISQEDGAAEAEISGEMQAPASSEASEGNVSKSSESSEPEKPLLSLPTTESQLAYMTFSPHREAYESGILPQMAEDAPEYCEKILQSGGMRFIIVDKAKMKLFLYDPYGNIEKSYGIACAKNFGTKRKKGDSRTTEGIFNVKGVFDSREWLFTDDNGYTSPKKGQYGPRFIRLTIPYIGIHGTGSPGSIGKRCSHGCIRVTNDNILELVKYVETGMPVIISPGPRDMAVNAKEGSHVLSVATEPGTPKAEATGTAQKAVTPKKLEKKIPEPTPKKEELSVKDNLKAEAAAAAAIDSPKTTGDNPEVDENASIKEETGNRSDLETNE